MRGAAGRPVSARGAHEAIAPPGRPLQRQRRIPDLLERGPCPTVLRTASSSTTLAPETRSAPWSTAPATGRSGPAPSRGIGAAQREAVQRAVDQALPVIATTSACGRSVAASVAVSPSKSRARGPTAADCSPSWDEQEAPQRHGAAPPPQPYLQALTTAWLSSTSRRVDGGHAIPLRPCCPIGRTQPAPARSSGAGGRRRARPNGRVARRRGSWTPVRSPGCRRRSSARRRGPRAPARRAASPGGRREGSSVSSRDASSSPSRRSRASRDPSGSTRPHDTRAPRSASRGVSTATGGSRRTTRRSGRGMDAASTPRG
jgi:hypothetical protein